MHFGGVYTTFFSAKKRAYLCKNMAIEMEKWEVLFKSIRVRGRLDSPALLQKLVGDFFFDFGEGHLVGNFAGLFRTHK